jgi:photosystem II stability/assembly factor-like uncharacterized protein
VNVIVESDDWHAITTGITETLKAVYFVDDLTGWVAGTQGGIYRTLDGGVSWQSQDSGTTEPLDDLYFLDSDRGWAVGGNSGPIIRRTLDGGETWEVQTSPSNTYLSAVTFVDETHGWIAGCHYIVWGWPPRFSAYGYILRSTDGGDSWFEATEWRGSCFSDVDFVDAIHGWVAAGRIDNSSYETVPLVFASSDGGETWVNQPLPVSVDGLNRIAFADMDHGWVVGDGGLILTTNDGGSTWAQQSSGGTDDLEAVAFVNATTGWVVSPILHTIDAGATWAPARADPACIGLSDLHFPDADRGWAVGNGGTVCKYH